METDPIVDARNRKYRKCERTRQSLGQQEEVCRQLKRNQKGAGSKSLLVGDGESGDGESDHGLQVWLSRTREQWDVSLLGPMLVYNPVWGGWLSPKWKQVEATSQR